MTSHEANSSLTYKWFDEWKRFDKFDASLLSYVCAVADEDVWLTQGHVAHSKRFISAHDDDDDDDDDDDAWQCQAKYKNLICSIKAE